MILEFENEFVVKDADGKDLCSIPKSKIDRETLGLILSIFSTHEETVQNAYDEGYEIGVDEGRHTGYDECGDTRYAEGYAAGKLKSDEQTKKV